MYSGNLQVTGKDLVGQGGGLEAEGEMITVVEKGVEEVRAYMAQPRVNSPMGLLYGIQWFLANRL